MATEFTLFPQLITELRLMIWQAALPTPLGRALYPFRKGCWVLEDLGLQLDPNGEDLDLRFDPGLLKELHIMLPLFHVNREARDVATKYIRMHKLVTRQGSAGAGYFRRFDPKTDIMFLPASHIDAFVSEHQTLLHEDPEMEGRYVGTSFPILKRLAITVAGFEAFRGDLLEEFFEYVGPVSTICIVELPSNSTFTLEEVEDGSALQSLELAEAPRARYSWNSVQRQWEYSGDPEMLQRMRDLVDGLDAPASATSEFNLEVQMIHLIEAGKS
ncbi:unnamed protein product [Zymoseptoria tritici ST99CH_3D7]|uniref:2EXR domain-containing protein n=1 Tax=Zymoseptoria tritici (strain ST99CH_3D7) TaxID=1276538 RepID=A0A1X7S4X3_ZYMT9|nr:unnamed protein product [Zymoseptoria tritici ST99CH_3D7]